MVKGETTTKRITKGLILSSYFCLESVLEKKNEQAHTVKTMGDPRLVDFLFGYIEEDRYRRRIAFPALKAVKYSSRWYFKSFSQIFFNSSSLPLL